MGCLGALCRYALRKRGALRALKDLCDAVIGGVECGQCGSDAAALALSPLARGVPGWLSEAHLERHAMDCSSLPYIS